jgi:hypothetical protein
MLCNYVSERGERKDELVTYAKKISMYLSKGTLYTRIAFQIDLIISIDCKESLKL